MSASPDHPIGDAGCGPVRCQATANTSIELFVALLEQAAEDSAGSLSIDQVHILAEAFKQAPGKLATFYAQTYADCSGQMIEENNPSSEIRNPFRQLMITQVSAGLIHGLPVHRYSRPDLFSPRLLKAFVKGLERLMPRPFVTQAHAKAIAIEARLRAALGDEHFSWAAYCQDSESHRLLAETMDELSHAFHAFGTQTEFLITEVNGLLGNVRVSKGVYKPGPPMVFGEQQFRKALKAMIGEFCGEHTAETEKSNAVLAHMDDTAKDRIEALYRKLA